jgi:hypothetical protein
LVLSIFRCYQNFTEKGFELNEKTLVRLFELPDFDETKMDEEYIVFYQEFPLTLIKARALDFIMYNLPTFENVLELNSVAGYFGNALNKDVFVTIEKLFKIRTTNIDAEKD